MKARLAAGCAIDVVWACMNLFLGIASLSPWYITLGCYYALLTAMRLPLAVLIFRRSGSEVGKASTAALRVERLCGIVLLVSVLVLSGIVTLVMTDNGRIYYADWLVYAVATFTFYFLISSIAKYVSRRSHDDPLERANTAINLSIGLVALFSLQIAMFASFGTAEDAQLMFVMPIITGTAVALIILLIGIDEIRKSLRQERKFRVL